VLENVDTAPVSPKDRALYRLVKKVVENSVETSQGDIDTARAAGWSDEALYDALSVVALFRFYNSWIDTTGVGDMPPFAYEMSGQRLATQGYISEEK
jgi:alkylhydroperoxidase family enzyme